MTKLVRVTRNFIAVLLFSIGLLFGWGGVAHAADNTVSLNVTNNYSSLNNMINSWSRVSVYNADGTQKYPGEWSVVNDGNNSYVKNAENTDNITGFYNPTTNFSNFWVSVDVGSWHADDDALGLLLRVSEDSSHNVTGYLVLLVGNTTYTSSYPATKSGIYKIEGKPLSAAALSGTSAGNLTLLKAFSDGTVWTRSAYKTLKATLTNSTIKVEFAGQTLTVTDSSISKGSYGFWSMSQPDVRFKNIKGEATLATFNLTFNPNGGNWSGSTANKTVSAISTRTYPDLPGSPSRTGYDFAGWYTAASGGTKMSSDIAKGKTVNIAQDQTFYAHWTPHTYNVVYNGNKPSAASNAVSGSTGTSSHTYDTARNLTANGFSLTGWTFTGWNTKADGTGTSYSNSQSVKNLTSASGETVNLYAQWKQNTYTVKYNSNKPDGVSNNPVKASHEVLGTTANSSHTYDVAKNLTANGYSLVGWTFTGWNTKADGSGTSYSNSQSVKNLTATDNGTVNLYAQWRPNTYTVVYNANKPSNATHEVIGTTADSSHTYDVAKNLTANGYSLIGWTFTGWNSKKDGSGTSYSNTQSVKNLADTDNGTVTLYAQWRAHKYKIYLEGNGNTNTVATPVMDMVYDDPAKNLTDNPYEVLWNITYVSEGTKPSPNPQQKTLSFLGWSEDASATTPDYMNRQGVKNLTDEDNGEIFLKAIWNQEDAVITMPGSVLAGSELQGWDDGGGSLYEEDDAYNLMEEGEGQNRTFTAVFEYVTYNITFDSNTGDQIDGMTYTTPELPKTLPNATKKDYVFTGWTGDNGTTPTINLVLPAGSTGDKHYVANWKRDGGIELTKYGAVTKTEHKGATKETDNDFSENNIPYPGESTITYYVTLTNTGNVDLYEIEIDDNILGGAGYDFKDWDGTLKAHESITLYAANPQIVTQSEINIGSKSNAVKVNSKMKDSGEALEELSADITTTFYKKDELKLVKEVAALHPHQGQTSSSNSEFTKADSPKAGESTIDYTFTVENTGNTTLTGVRLADAMIEASSSASLSLHGDLTNGAITLNYGDSFDADASGYVLTQSDVNAGRVDNTATVTAASQATGSSGVSATDSAAVTIAADPSISLTKEVTELTLDGHTPLGRTYGFRDGDDVRAGVSTVAWRLTLTNTGNVPLNGISFSDPKAVGGGASITNVTVPSVIMPGESATAAVGRYKLSVSDIDNGIIENVATATANAPGGERVSATSNVATTSISQSSELVLEMTVNKTMVTGSDIQSTKNLTWDLTLTNAGNTTFSNISVVSSFFARQGVTVNFDWANSTDPATPSNELSGGEVVKATVTAPIGVLIWKDKGDGSEVATLVNEAYVTVNTPGVAGKVSTDIAKTTTTFISKPSISATITPSPSQVSDGDYTGNPVNYTIIITNTGDVELTDVDYTTTDLGYITIDWGSSSNASTGDRVLAPGERVTATATRLATRDEVNAGHMDATATFKGTTNQGMTVTSKADARTSFAAMPAIVAGKFVDDRDYESLSGNVTVGTKIPYRIEVENTGNVTLTNVTVEDMLAGATSPDYGEWDRSLAPGEKRIVKLFYTTRLSDLANGGVVNRASVTGYAPDGNRATATATAAEVSLTIAPQLTAYASDPVTVTPDSAYAGARITEVYTVENTGDSTVTGIDMSGWFADNSVVTFKWPSTNRTLKPGEKATVKVVYPLTQEDLDRGYAESNNVFAGSDLIGRPVSCNLERKVPIEVLEGSISMTAKDYNATLTNAVVGKKARFSFEVTNNWNGTVSGIVLMPTDKRFTVIGKPVKLAAGKSAELTVETTLTQDDINRGHIEFKMRASGSTVNGNTVTRTALTPHRKLVKQNNAIKLELTAPAEIVNVLAGRTVEYYYSIQNTGNTTLSALDLANSVQGLVNLRFDGSEQLESLAPGRKILASAVYPVTQEDIDRGYVENTGKASGSSPARKNVEDVQLVKTYLRPAEYATEYPDQPENPAGLRLRLDVADGVFVWVDDSGQRIRTASGTAITLPDGTQAIQNEDGTTTPARPTTKPAQKVRDGEPQQFSSTGDNPIVLFAAAGIAIIAIGGLVVARRRRF